MPEDVGPEIAGPSVTLKIVVGLSVETMTAVDLKVTEACSDAPAVGTGVADSWRPFT